MKKDYIKDFDTDLLRNSKILSKLQGYMNYMESKMYNYKYMSNKAPKADQVSDSEAKKLTNDMSAIYCVLLNHFEADPVDDPNEPEFQKEVTENREPVQHLVDDLDNYSSRYSDLKFKIKALKLSKSHK